MILRLLKLPFRLVGFAFSLVFVGGMLEFFGLMMYMTWKNEAALDRLVAGGVTPPELLQFLQASPDRMLVAGGIAVLAVFFVLSGGSGGAHSHDGLEAGFGGGDHGGGHGGDGGGGGGGGDGGE